MQEDDEYIKFDEMPDMFGRMFAADKQPDKTVSITPNKTYGSLFEELCDKCYPERYMEPYNAKLVSAATKLYSEVLESEDKPEMQNELRHRAYKELSVKFDGTKLYQYLMDYLNPRLYLKPFCPDKLEIANNYYPEIEANKDDYIQLENIQSDVQWFIDKLNKEREIEFQKEFQKEIESAKTQVVHTDSIEKQKEEDAWRRYNADQALLEDIRNSLGDYHWKKFIEEEYGGYIKV